MTRINPVFTGNNECQDCYKCIRFCEVKAIRVQNNRATIIPSRCLACGRCVTTCPSQAKKIRSDLGRVRSLVASPRRVIVSLAPSWRGSFEFSTWKMVYYLKTLGFNEVSETALGAEMVTTKTAEIINASGPKLHISSACPVIVDYIRLYKPEYIPALIPLASPALTHAGFLKKIYGDIKVVFIGPCAAKKNESDRNPDLLAATLTFEELKIWLSEEDPAPALNSSTAYSFVPESAHEGVLYPLNSGQSETLRRLPLKPEIQLLNLSSLDLFIRALNKFDPTRLDCPIFIEALACEGGCVSGPAMASRRSDFLMAAKIRAKMLNRSEAPNRIDFFIPVTYQPANLTHTHYSLDEIQRALNNLGKYNQEDELNCSGCGYHSCREMAHALLDGNTELVMCTSYMRRIATRKTAAMFKSMPSAMVMLDRNLHILEANEAFIRLFVTGNETQTLISGPDQLIGEPIQDYLELTNLCKTVLRTGEDIHKEHYLIKKHLYDIYIFCSNRDETIGLLVTDITLALDGREKIARKAREVISKNIAIVQEIACLLGEHMVETEIILNSIAEDYADKEEEEEKEI